LAVFDIGVKNGTHNYVTLLASSAISIPQYQFYIAFPFISPYLAPFDFLNLDERAKAGLSAASALTIRSLAGEMSNYAFRSVYVAHVQDIYGAITQYWEWDKSSGFLIKYINIFALPYAFSLIDTNVWVAPINQIYKPTSVLLYISDLYSILAKVGGAYFTHWELWALTLGIILGFVFQGWFIRYYDNRKRLLAAPQLGRLLRKVETQEKKVLYIKEGGKWE
jgi:hypothetical protein